MSDDKRIKVDASVEYIPYYKFSFPVKSPLRDKKSAVRSKDQGIGKNTNPYILNPIPYFIHPRKRMASATRLMETMYAASRM